jgi:hypothetical protein
MGLLLNTKHEKMAHALARGGSIIESYVHAGFKRNAASASKLAARPEMKARVAELVEFRNRLLLQNEIKASADIALDMGITKKAILEKLWAVAQTCLKGTPIFDKSGEEKGRKIDAQGATRALQLLGMESYSMFIDRLEVGNPGDFSRLTDEELAQKVAQDVEALGFDPGSTEVLLAMFKGNGVKH